MTLDGRELTPESDISQPSMAKWRPDGVGQGEALAGEDFYLPPSGVTSPLWFQFAGYIQPALHCPGFLCPWLPPQTVPVW